MLYHLFQEVVQIFSRIFYHLVTLNKVNIHNYYLELDKSFQAHLLQTFLLNHLVIKEIKETDHNFIVIVVFVVLKKLDM